jgi:hypothetical protein
MDYTGRWAASVTRDELAQLDPMANEGKAVDIDGHAAVLAFHSTLISGPHRTRNAVYLEFGLPPRRETVAPAVAEFLRRMARSGGFVKVY